MSPEELKARARRLAEEVINQGDLAVLDEIVAAEYLHHDRGIVPGQGRTGIRSWVNSLRRGFPDVHGIIEDEIAEGDRVVQRMTLRGTHEGEFLGVAPTGAHIAIEVIDINRAGPAGTFVEHWLSVDRFDLSRQLGAMPRSNPVSGLTLPAH
jgi:predicted ester cyclase